MIGNASGGKLARSAEFVALGRGDAWREPRGAVFASEEACSVPHGEGMDRFSLSAHGDEEAESKDAGGEYNHQESCQRWSWSP